MIHLRAFLTLDLSQKVTWAWAILTSFLLLAASVSMCYVVFLKSMEGRCTLALVAWALGTIAGSAAAVRMLFQHWRKTVLDPLVREILES